MEMLDRFGWQRVDREQILEIRQRLSHLETMTWSSILVSAKKQNHSVEVYKIIPEAQAWLAEREILLDKITLLHCSNKEVIWGYLAENGVFVLLWWDPLHQVYPVEKKHT